MIYDAHSHIGIDAFHSIEGKLSIYIKNALTIGITETNLMPVPSPVYFKKNSKITSFLWRVNSNKFDYFLLEKSQNAKNEFPIKLNPYYEVNKLTEKILVSTKHKIKINFIPLINPLFDSLNYIRELLSKKPKAMKVHGIACGMFPEKFPKQLLEYISYSNVPLIVHTDYLNTFARTPLENFYKHNTALRWINLLKIYGIKGFITHGGRLEEKALEEINMSDLFCVGLSPDRLISSEKRRIALDTPYLETIFDKLDINKICFDVDYPWNVKSRNTQDLDWQLLSRLRNFISEKDYINITYNNAKNFFTN